MTVWRRLILACSILVIFAITFFAIFVNPSHWRVHQVESASLRPFEKFYMRVGSLFSKEITYSIDVSDFQLSKAKNSLLKAFPETPIVTDSNRLEKKNQVYFSAGLYPFRLDGQDAVLVPNDATLSFSFEEFDKIQVRFWGLSPGSAGNLEVAVDSSAAKIWKISDVALATPFVGSMLDKKVPGIFDFDKLGKVSGWTPVVFDAARSVSITCRNAKYGCLVGEPTFYYLASEKPRNFLVILVDTMRWDAITSDVAPNLERLKSRSTYFANAISPGNMTAPSTNAFLACRKASSIGDIAFAYSVDSNRREAHYLQKVPSFPQLFANAGFNTAMIGNISVISEVYGVGIDHGFKRQISIEVDPFDTPLIAREAISWLAQNGDAPFLLYVHFNGPHAPYRAPWSDLLKVSKGVFEDFSSYANFLKWTYRGEISYADSYIGRLLDALDRLGLDDSTTIVVTADHGDQHALRPFVDNHVADDFSGSYFDHGATLFNDEIRVPLVIREPKQWQGQIRREFVSTLDVAPTLLSIANIEVPSYCDGESFRKSATRNLLGSEGFRGRSIIFDNQWKYIKSYEPTDKFVFSESGWVRKRRLFMIPEALYNLSSDPEERQNLIHQNIPVLNRARRLYREYFNIGHAFELVIDDPNGVGWKVSLPRDLKVEVSRTSVAVETTETASLFEGSEPGRYVLTIRGDLRYEPSVDFGNREASILKTTQRLPVRISPDSLPLESGGEQTLLPITESGGVTLRRIYDDGQASRRIILGNPRFDAILRDWGYLNDQ